MPSGDHCFAETVTPSSDPYCIDTVVPSSDDVIIDTLGQYSHLDSDHY